MELSKHEKQFLKLYDSMLTGTISIHEFCMQIEYIPDLPSAFLEYWQNRKNSKK